MFNLIFNSLLYYISTFVLTFTVGYLLYTISPTCAVIIGSCLVLRLITQNIIITMLKETITKGEKLND